MPLSDIVRPLFHRLREAGIDVQSPHRRSALSPYATQQRIFAKNPAKIVLDCGAHHGRVARRLASIHPSAQVYSFEPTPATFEVLQREVAGHSRITAVNAAVGEADATMDFYIYQDEQINSLLPQLPGQSERPKKVSVRVCRIDQFCRDRQTGRVDILKLDVEGFEGPALRGCGALLDNQSIDMIYAETRFNSENSNTTFLELCGLLTPRGYQFFGLYDPIFKDDLQLLVCDVMFVSSRRLAEYRG